MIKIMIKLIRALPHIFALKFGAFAGRVLWLVSWKKVDTCESRCVTALGVGVTIARKIILNSFVNIGRSVVEFIRLDIMKKNLDDFIEFENLNIVDEALARNKGVLFMLAHMGNWELAGEKMTAMGYEVCAVYTPQKNTGGANDFIMQQREKSANMLMIPAHSAGLREIFKALKSNKIVCILQDLDARRAGVDVEFMGMPASAYDGIIKIFNKLKSPVVPVLCIREPDNFLRHKVIFYDILSDKKDLNNRPFGEDLNASLAMCNDLISDWIRKYPENWMWILDRWESKMRAREIER